MEPRRLAESRSWPAGSSSPHPRHQERRRPWHRRRLPTERADLRQQPWLVPLRLRTGIGTGQHQEATAVAACRSHRAVAAVREGSTMAVSAAHRPLTTTLITMIAIVCRGEMVAAVVGGIVTTPTHTITEIRMTVIIAMATDTEIADAEVGDGPAAVEAEAEAEAILGADRTRTVVGHLGMSVGIGTATTVDGNGLDRGQGRRTTEGGRIVTGTETGTEMVADRHEMAIRIAEAGGDGVAARPTDERIAIAIAMKAEGTKNDSAAENRERQRAMRLVGGIVTMIRQEGNVTATATARLLSVTERVEKEIAKGNVGGVDLEAGLAKKGRGIEWRKAKRKRNVEK